VPDDVDLWEATDEQLAPAYELYRALRSGGVLAGVGRTTASKLMARKRPRPIPIVDSAVRGALEIEGDSWIELRSALRAADGVGRIEVVRLSLRAFVPGVYTAALRRSTLDASQQGTRSTERTRTRIGA
jgi:hypothetical protein